jgi:NADP-dependent 3-hydroxy acid dehydrogenase YdfG
MNRLKGRTAWVTGAGTGIGRGIALALANEGVHLILSGRRIEPLEEVAEQVKKTGQKATVAPLDVTDRDQVNQIVEQTSAEMGTISLLVNNAGTNTANRTVTEMAPEDWDRVVDINLTGAFNCFRGVYPQMKANGDSMVINIASMAGRQISLLGGAAYTASKHAMVSLTHSINLEAADFGVRASVILPGEADTPLIAKRPHPVSEKRQSLMLKPEDLGATAVFVANMPPHVTIPELWIMPTYQVSATPLP